MQIRFEAGRLCDYVKGHEWLARSVGGTVISVYVYEDDMEGRPSKMARAATTELNDDERRMVYRRAEVDDSNLWFRIIQDGVINLSIAELTEVNSARMFEGLVDEKGLLRIFPSTFVESVGCVICTHASTELATFLAFFYGHYRSSVAFHTALSLHHRLHKPESSDRAPLFIKDAWNGDTDPRPKPSNPELWVDISADVISGGLPLLFLGSSTTRIFPLILRDLWGTTSRNSRGQLWESLYLSSLLQLFGLNHDNPNALVTSLTNCSPFSLFFGEMILAGKTTIALKHTERCVFDVNLSQRVVRIEARQTGGRVDNHLFIVKFGTKRLSRQLIISNSVDPEAHLSMMGRLSPRFNQAHYSTGMPFLDTLRAELLSITRMPVVRFNESEFVKRLQECWFSGDVDSHYSIVHAPVNLADALSLMLLVQLLWITIPVLREKAEIILASPSATLMCNTLRLLIDALSPSVRDLFVCTKNYLLCNLLEGMESRKYTHMVESFSQLNAVLMSSAPFKLIISTPASINEGWSKDIYKKYIQKNPSAKLLLTTNSRATQPTYVETSPSPAVPFEDNALMRVFDSIARLMETQESPSPTPPVPMLSQAPIEPTEESLLLANDAEGLCRAYINKVFDNLREIKLVVKPTNIKMPTAWDDLASHNAFLSFHENLQVVDVQQQDATTGRVCAMEACTEVCGIDAVEFTKCLIRAPYQYVANEPALCTEVFPIVQVPVNASGLEVVSSKLTDWDACAVRYTQPDGEQHMVRCRLSSSQVQPSVIGALGALGAALSRPSEPSTPAAGDSWLLGLLKGLGDALRPDESAEAKITAPVNPEAAQKVYCRAAHDSEAHKAAILVGDLPGSTEQLVNQVHHTMVSTLNLSTAAVPELQVVCEDCSPECLASAVHTLRIKSQGFGSVHLGVLQSLT